MDKSILENLIDKIYLNGTNDTDVTINVTGYNYISASFVDNNSNLAGKIEAYVTYFPNATFVLPESNRFKNLLGSVNSEIDVTYGPNYIRVTDDTSVIKSEIRYLVEDLSIPNPIQNLSTIRSVKNLPELPTAPELPSEP